MIEFFITLENPTKPMIKEALTTGYYYSEPYQRNFLRIQIKTIEDLLSGKKLDLPYTLPPFKEELKFVPQN